MKSIVCYVDGYNFYFGLRRRFNGRKFLWLDIKKFLERIIRDDEEITDIKYFTSLPISNHSKSKRHKTYINALQSTGIKIYKGFFVQETKNCGKPEDEYVDCDHMFTAPKEKLTDVSIATEMLSDAYNDRFDKAYLLGGDTDLCPAIKKIKREFKGLSKKSVFLVFPDKSVSDKLTKIVGEKWLVISEKDATSSQFQNPIVLPDGTTLHKPSTWV